MFLAGGLLALLAIPAWVWIRATGAAPWGAVPMQLWHAHEMLFGFVIAAIAGFLSTAVPNWTGTRPAAGLPLAALALLWIAARVLLAIGPGPTWWLASGIELAVIPALVALIAPPLLRTRNRNRVMLLALAALWAADATFMWAIGRGQPLLASRALLASIDLALLMVTIVGGRIIPSFTANALRLRGIATPMTAKAWIESPLPVLMALNAVVDAVVPGGRTAAAIAGVVAVLHAWRLAGWQGLSTRREPIVWSLHLAYAWLPVGFTLKAVSLAWAWPVGAFWMHALGAGALATMVFAVTTRVALGHTGRPLRVSTPVAWAYALLSLGVLARIALPHAGTLDYRASLVVAAALWSAAFLVFVRTYAPILVGPRADGNPG